MLEMLPKQLPHHAVGHLPNNINGHRTTHTCELCGFEPKTKNKTGSGIPKIANTALLVYTCGFYGQMVGDMTKSHRVDPP